MKLGEVPLCVLGSKFGGWVKLLPLHLSAYQSLMPEPFGPCSCGGSNYCLAQNWKKQRAELILMGGVLIPLGQWQVLQE